MEKRVLLRKLVHPNTSHATANLTIGNRIPKDYFIAKGTGESDITVHAGSFHLALKAAGIEMCNIINYSSILPGIATEIKKPKQFVHGSVMESIMAAANAEKGQQATSGIIYGWLFDKKTGDKYGGLACEYNGDKPVQEASEQLRESLQELYENGFTKKYSLKNIRLLTESIIPEKNFGTAIVSLCFVNYSFPVLGVHLNE